MGREIDKFLSMLSPATLGLLLERLEEYRREVRGEAEETAWCGEMRERIRVAMESKQ